MRLKRGYRVALLRDESNGLNSVGHPTPTVCIPAGSEGVVEYVPETPSESIGVRLDCRPKGDHGDGITWFANVPDLFEIIESQVTPDKDGVE